MPIAYRREKSRRFTRRGGNANRHVEKFRASARSSAESGLMSRRPTPASHAGRTACVESLRLEQRGHAMGGLSLGSTSQRKPSRRGLITVDGTAAPFTAPRRAGAASANSEDRRSASKSSSKELPGSTLIQNRSGSVMKDLAGGWHITHAMDCTPFV